MIFYYLTLEIKGRREHGGGGGRAKKKKDQRSGQKPLWKVQVHRTGSWGTVGQRGHFQGNGFVKSLTIAT